MLKIVSLMAVLVASSSLSKEAELNSESIGKAFEAIVENSITPISEQKKQAMLHAALLALLRAYSEPEKEKQQIFANGEQPVPPQPITGIGIGLTLIHKPEVQLRITDVFANTPASNAGLQVGDLVIDVDKRKSSTFANIDEVVGAIRGPAKTPVCLLISSNGKEKSVCVTRKEIVSPSLKTYAVSNMGVLEVISLPRDNRESVHNAFSAIKGKQTIVFDFRFTEWSEVMGGVNLLSEMLPKNTILFERKSNNDIKVYRSHGSRKTKKPFKHVIVLQAGRVGGITEVITRVLQQHYPQTMVIGEESKGNMFVETLVPLANQNFSVLIPTAELVGTKSQWVNGPIIPNKFVPNIFALDFNLLSVLEKMQSH